MIQILLKQFTAASLASLAIWTIPGCQKSSPPPAPIVGIWVADSGDGDYKIIDRDSLLHSFADTPIRIHFSMDTLFESNEGGKKVPILKVVKLTDDSLILKFLEADIFERYGRASEVPADLVQKPASVTAFDSVMAELEGDLDKDGVSERVKAVRLAGSTSENVQNYLLIEKKYGDEWKFFFADSSVLGNSDWNIDGASYDAGTLSIERGTLLLDERAGTFQSTRSRYRRQNDDMYLIGITSSSYVQSDDDGTVRTTDCNLLTGDVIVKYSRGDSVFNKHTFKSADIKPIRMNGYGQNFRIADPLTGDTIRMSIHDQE